MSTYGKVGIVLIIICLICFMVYRRHYIQSEATASSAPIISNWYQLHEGPEREVMVLHTLAPTPEPTAEFSTEDIRLMARVVYSEARGESDLGQKAVAQVIINRVHSGTWPGTVSKVVNAPGQFVMGIKYTEKEITNVKAAIADGVRLPDGRLMPVGVVCFGTWQFRTHMWQKIGNHYFMY